MPHVVPHHRGWKSNWQDPRHNSKPHPYPIDPPSAEASKDDEEKNAP